MLNLVPILKSNQPTTYLEIGRSKIGPTADVVRVQHRNRTAFVRVKAVEDDIVDDIGNKVKMHENFADLFGGIDRGSDFLVDPEASAQQVPECSSAKLFVEGGDERDVEAFLRESNYLLHPIEEVIAGKDAQVRVHVRGLEPAGYTTVRVTAGTEIEFLDSTEFQELSAESTAVGAGTGDSGSSGSDEMDVDLDLTPKKPTKSFAEDVAGLEEVKRTAEMLLALFDPTVREEVIDRYGEGFAARGNSMLLYGPPGCGKTLVSEAIAHEAKYETNIEEQYGEVKFLEVKGSDILSKYPGEAERRVEAAFEQAHAIAREGFAVLFFDEVETLIPDRSDDTLQRHERSLTNAFLQEMNDVEDNLLVIGATNMPFSIDPAATRRFPIQQFIPQPDERVMAEVWRKHLTDLPGADAIDFERLAEESLGYTPAEIADRVLGSELQRDLVESVVRGEPVVPDTEYLLDRLVDTEPKTVSQYVAKVRHKIDDLEGYPELRRYVEEEVGRLGIGDDADGEDLAATVQALLGEDELP